VDDGDSATHQAGPATAVGVQGAIHTDVNTAEGVVADHQAFACDARVSAAAYAVTRPLDV
jgi:hypothetical protein